MNKAELVDAIANDAGISKSQAQSALDAALEHVQGALKGGDKVTLVGFGTFSTSHRDARTGRNPQTGKEIQIPAKTVVKFTAGKALKEAVQ
ncbi:MAG TPA: HU family DNA-binding protein [Acidobacteriota bacterium]|nr:HU family DNA-binding protein [Acidobacteriota bacterium]